MPSALLDTGLLVAFVNRHDRYHGFVLTLDSDFAIYRKHRNRSIAVITPFA